MKSSIFGKIATLCFFGTFANSAFAAVDAPYEVGTWGNFCKGAVSHTFDDYPYTGTQQQVGTGQAAFDAKGLHMTLFVITGSVTDWSKLKTAFAKGHEIASHTQTHATDANQLLPSQEAIKKNVPGEMCVGFAYPDGKTIAGVLKNYIAARNISGANNPKTPGDFSQINTQGFGAGQGNYANTATAMNSWADQAASGNKWGTAMHHGIGKDQDPKHTWAMTNIDEMVKHLDYLDKNRDKIWCETFGNVARYIKERDVAAVTKKDSTDKGITITVTDNLADSIFNYPLTIRRPLPDGWTTAIVTQKDKPVKDTVVTVSSKQYIMFDAIPDGGDVVISKNLSSIHQSTNRNTTGSAPVVRQKSNLLINPSLFNGSSLTVSLFDLTGKLLIQQSLKTGESCIALPTGKINQSAFVAKISGGGNTWSGMFMPQL